MKKKIVLIIVVCFIAIGIVLIGKMYKCGEAEPDWATIKLNETTITFPFPYRELEKAGFKLTEKQQEEIWDLKPGNSNMGPIELATENKGYDITVKAIFSNLDSKNGKIKPVTECSATYFRCIIWSLDTPYPSICIANQVEWGASEEDIVNVLGEPAHIDRGFIDYGYSLYTYETSQLEMELVIYAERGSGGVEFHDKDIK